MSVNAIRSTETHDSDFDRRTISVLGGLLGITFGHDTVERVISAKKQPLNSTSPYFPAVKAVL